MVMTLTHDGAPGHTATATVHGWACSCGAGTRWPDGERPRVRAVGGARRHLTAAARNNPDNARAVETVDLPDAPAEDEAPAETPAEEPDPTPAPVSLVSQFRSPPRADQ